jgi:hypothetical protein
LKEEKKVEGTGDPMASGGTSDAERAEESGKRNLNTEALTQEERGLDGQIKGQISEKRHELNKI